jgi:hypothetical protein
MDFQPLDQPTRLGGFKRFVQGSRLVGVQVVHNQHDLFRLGIVFVHQLPDYLSEVDLGASISHLNVALASQRLEEHKQVGRAISLILFRTIRFLFGVIHGYRRN